MQLNQYNLISYLTKKQGITSASSMQSTDLAYIGACFITVLPSSYIDNLEISTIITYYGSLGYIFQPDNAIISLISTKIE